MSDDEYTPDHPNFRTKICRHWLRGHCLRGDKCNFAHGFTQVVRKVRKERPGLFDVEPSNIQSIKEVPKATDVVYNPMKELIADYVVVSHRDVEGV